MIAEDNTIGNVLEAVIVINRTVSKFWYIKRTLKYVYAISKGTFQLV